MHLKFSIFRKFLIEHVEIKNFPFMFKKVCDLMVEVLAPLYEVVDSKLDRCICAFKEI
jgi:hypothetical protein